MAPTHLHPDEMVFSITEVAKQIGVVPTTIRNWERQGLFIPKRGENKYRRFTFQDIETLRNIKEYSKDKHMGINAVKLLVQGRPAYSLKREEGNVSRKLLSQKWKESRLQRGYSLDDVAEATGISVSYLSKIENMQANVSLNVLKTLAEFYGENLLYYVSEPAQESHLVKKHTGEVFSAGISGVSIESLVSLKNSHFSNMLYTVDPGCGRNRPSSHHGDEFVYVLSGKVRFWIGDGNEYTLTKGDALTFHSMEAHAWCNVGSSQATILWAYTAAAQE